MRRRIAGPILTVLNVPRLTNDLRWRALVGVLVAACLLLILVGSVRALSGEPVGGFRQTVMTDRASYRGGELVIVGVRVCRSRLWPAATSSSGGTNLLTSFEVVDERGLVVADDTHAVRTLELRRVSWFPGQCRYARHEWDQHYWNREDPFDQGALGAPVRGDRVAPGDYRARVMWFTGRPAEPVVSESFAIAP